MSSAADIIAFWRDSGSERWFAHDADFDRIIGERFRDDHQAAACGALAGWEDNANGALALVILTDQFPRNLYRGSAHAFATDAMAREVTERAIARAFDRDFDPPLRQFFYLPFQHHEDMGAQMRRRPIRTAGCGRWGGCGVALCPPACGLDRPLRPLSPSQCVMGRVPTPEETAYLAGGGFAG